MPWLNQSQLRRASLQLQRNRLLIPSGVNSGKIGKQKWMARVYRACSTNNFEGFEVGFASSLGSSLWQTRFHWASKKAGLSRIARHWDLSIAQEKAPFQKPENGSLADFQLDTSNPFWFFEPPLSNSSRTQFTRFDASELVLLTAMAARSFALEHGRNPRNLNELVPHFLLKVEADPFKKPRPLRYDSKPRTYLQLHLNNDANSLPPLNAPNSPLRRTRETLPFLLYSVGLNCRDQGGMNFEAAASGRQVPNDDDIPAPADWFQTPK